MGVIVERQLTVLFGTAIASGEFPSVRVGIPRQKVGTAVPSTTIILRQPVCRQGEAALPRVGCVRSRHRQRGLARCLELFGATRLYWAYCGSEIYDIVDIQHVIANSWLPS